MGRRRRRRAAPKGKSASKPKSAPKPKQASRSKPPAKASRSKASPSKQGPPQTSPLQSLLAQSLGAGQPALTMTAEASQMSLGALIQQQQEEQSRQQTQEQRPGGGLQGLGSDALLDGLTGRERPRGESGKPGKPGKPGGRGAAQGGGLGQLLSDVILWLTDGLEDRWEQVGRLTGQVADACWDLSGDDADLDWILGPLFGALEQTASLSKEQLVALVEAIGAGNQALLQAAARWIRETFTESTWPGFFVGVGEQARDAWLWVWQWILELLGEMWEGWVELLENFRALNVLFERVLALPEQLLEAAPLEQAWDSVQGLVQLITGGGFLAWIVEQADGQRLQPFLRGLLTNNPLVEWTTQASNAVLNLLGQAGGAAAELTQARLDQWIDGLQQLAALERQLWDLIFAGGAGEDPWVAVVRADGVFDDEPPTFAEVANVNWSSFPNQLRFVTLEGRRGAEHRMRVPHPTWAGPVDWEQPVPPNVELFHYDLPLPFGAVAWDCSLAVAHLPEYYAIDMRYHMPYGGIPLYRIADFDGDGLVTQADVDRVLEARERNENGGPCDLDRDGKVTDHDVDLAAGQLDNLVSGIVYRKMESGVLAFFVSTSPLDWAYCVIDSCLADSVDGKIERRGILEVVDGYVGIPIPAGAGIQADDPVYAAYPIRYHLEYRIYADQFPQLAQLPLVGGGPDLGPFGWGQPIPGIRTDLIVRGGWEGCADWQLYARSDIGNVLLRTWAIRASVYLRGLVGAVGAGKGDIRVQLAYETETPLIEVITQWHQRLRTLQTNPPDLIPDELPIPWQMIVDTIEFSELPRMARALIQIVGPFLDLLLDWTDPDRDLRAALGYIRQSVLNQWEPAPTWAQLRRDVRAWSDVPAPELEAALTAITETQAALGLGDHDPVYTPRRVQAAVEDAVGAAQAAAEPAVSRALEHSQALFVAGRARFAASLDQLVADKELIVDDRPRETPPRTQVPLCGELEVLHPFLVAVPFDLKRDYATAKASVGAHSKAAPKKDERNAAQRGVDSAQEWVGDPIVGELLEVRGNPFYKPIYHTLLECGPDAKLYTAPSRQHELFLRSVPEHHKAMVEGRRALRDVASGDVWLWVRLEDWQHGWLPIEGTLWEQLVSPQSMALSWAGGQAQALTPDAVGLAGEVVPLVLVPALLTTVLTTRAVAEAHLDAATPRKPILRLEASARDTVDDTAWAWRCRDALARLSVTDEDLTGLTRAGETPGLGELLLATPQQLEDAGKLEHLSDDGMRQQYELCLQELKIRVFGYEHAQAMDEDGDEDLAEENAELALAFNSFSHAKREKLWAAGTAWLKCLTYLPPFADELASLFVDAFVGQGRFEGQLVPQRIQTLWGQILELLRRCGDATMMEALLAVQSSAPAVRDLVLAMLDLAEKFLNLQAAIAEHWPEDEEEESTDEASEEAPETPAADASAPEDETHTAASTSTTTELDEDEDDEDSIHISAHGGGKIPDFATFQPDPTAPEFRNLPAMLARLLVDDPEEPGRPPSEPHPNAVHDWGMTFSYDVELDIDLSEEEEDEPDEGQRFVVRLAYPIVTEVVVTPKTGFDVSRVTLEATRFGAIVFHEDGYQYVESADPERFPADMGPAATRWRVSPDGGRSWTDLDLQGPEVQYDMGFLPEPHRPLTFEAYIGQPLEVYFGPGAPSGKKEPPNPTPPELGDSDPAAEPEPEPTSEPAPEPEEGA